MNTDNNDSVDYILDGLVSAGFNGVRLPMWPESDQVRGPDPTNESRDISREFCESLTNAWINRIRKAPEGSAYGDFVIYMSPGLDNRTFQETLSESAYGDWVLSYIELYQPEFVSPFSANDSTLRFDEIPANSYMSDEVTMWEMDTLKKLKKKDAWNNLTEQNTPQIIGPDRHTTQHTLNTLNTFDGSRDFIRPEYESLVDILGT